MSQEAANPGTAGTARGLGSPAPFPPQGHLFRGLTHRGAPRPAHLCSAYGRRAAARPAAAPGRARRRGRGWPGSGRAAAGRSGGSRGPPPPCPAGRLSPSAPPWLWRSRNCGREPRGRDSGHRRWRGRRRPVRRSLIAPRGGARSAARSPRPQG